MRLLGRPLVLNSSIILLDVILGFPYPKLLTMGAFWFGLVALALILFGRELYRARTRIGRAKSAPGLLTLLSPLSSFNSHFPRLPFVCLGANWSWRLNYKRRVVIDPLK